MSAVQAGGGKGSGQRPGSPGGRAPTKPKPQGDRSGAPPAKGAGQRPAGASGRRPATKPGSGGRGAGGGGKGRPPGSRPPAGAPQRFSPTTIGFIVIAVVVVIIVAFVLVKVTGKSNGSNASTVAPTVTPADPAVVSAVTGVSLSEADQVGLPSTSEVVPPTLKTGQSALVLGGKPGALFIGAEFCPYCAAERWAIIMAFSRFGTFSNLKETTSSPWDTDPSTPTFTFADASYSSSYLTFDPVEHESNDKNGLDTRTVLQPLTAQQSKLWARYDGGASNEGYPFLDIGNKYLVTEPSYNPQLLSGLDQQDVASMLKNPKSSVTQAIVGTANYLTAALCGITGQRPASVCSASVVTQAAKAMGTG